MKALQLNTLKQIVVIRLDHIGDLLNSTPFLQWLRAGCPQAQITVLVRSYTREVLANAPFVDRVLVYDETQPTQSKALIAQLGAQELDLVISLAPNRVSYRLAYQLKARWRVGYVYRSRPVHRLLCYLWLSDTYVWDIDGLVRQGKPVPHEVEQQRALAQGIGLATPSCKLSFTAEPEAVEQAKVWMEDFALNGCAPSPTLVFHLHTHWLSCGWNIEDLQKLLSMLLEQSGRVIVTFGPAEAALAAQLSKALVAAGGSGSQAVLAQKYDYELVESSQGRVAFMGGIPFGLWAGIIKAGDLTVSCDTGAVHVAAAAGRPVVVVFEPRVFKLCSQQWAPWKVPSVLLKKGEAPLTSAAIVQGVRSFLNHKYES